MMLAIQESSEYKPAVYHSSGHDEWSTPGWIYESLNREFSFNLDPCCTPEMAKCSQFYTAMDDGLSKRWSNRNVFMNPPYSNIARWMEKAYISALEDGCTVVCLVPARTDMVWFHEYALKGEIRFIRGRLKFGNAKDGAPFPSMIVVFRPPNRGFMSMSVAA